MSYNKSSVKLLSVIQNYENNTVLYSELDGNFTVGDKLYIMVIDSSTPEYSKIDSFQTVSNTYKSIGYELLSKEGNKLILDIDYTNLTTGIGAITGLTTDNCYIGRVYISNGTIYNGSINGALLYNVSLVPKSILNLLWYQGILRTSPLNSVKNIDFNTITRNKLVMKSEVNNDNTINSYYTVNNYGIGLSIINLLPNSPQYLQINNSNINAGIFNHCEFVLPSTAGVNDKIYNGIFNNCYIGSRYIIDGAILNYCELENSFVEWRSGTWKSNPITDLSNNLFRTSVWSGGTWEDGVFPSTSIWFDGRFKKGTFNGVWNNGTFGTKESILSDTIFNTTIWNNGSFNGGSFSGSTWMDGTFNNGVSSGSTWYNGTFNNGTFTDCLHWYDGTFNNGTFNNSIWHDGTFNMGTFNGSIWETGDFNNGNFIDSTWYNGYFYDGKFENSTWNNGCFYKGSMFDSDWNDGDLFFGVFNSVDWYGGTWHDGIANSVKFFGGTWKNGIFNFGYFYNGTWLNGSFNAGYFSGETSLSDSVWKYGNFYFGEFSGLWSGGTFYMGKQTSIPQKDIIGRPYMQYNKSGLFSTNYKSVRLPAKKKY